MAADFYNAGALLGLSDEHLVEVLLNDEKQDGLLTKAVPEFKAKIVDSFVYRAPGAVSLFSPGSFPSRPPLIVPGFNRSIVCAGIGYAWEKEKPERRVCVRKGHSYVVWRW